MSSNPRWWPYRLPIKEAIKKSAVLVIGVITGANVISYIWKPMQAKLSFSGSTKRLMMSGIVELAKSNNNEQIIDENESQDGRHKRKVTVVDHYNSDNESQMTVFKKLFKTYKRRVPPPDLSSVLDPLKCDLSLGVVRKPLEKLHMMEVQEKLVEELGLRPIEEWIVTTLMGRDGLYILSNVLREEAHETWLEKVFMYAEPPNVTNMTKHGMRPKGDVLSDASTNLRWTTMGVMYDWNTKEYPLSGEPLPTELCELSKVVSTVLGLDKMMADAAIINYYPPKSTLSPHIDRSERTHAPLVSLSLGQSAVYLTGGVSLDDPVVPIWLRSGDILVMHGSQRLVYHAVPSIHKTRKNKYNIINIIKIFRTAPFFSQGFWTEIQSIVKYISDFTYTCGPARLLYIPYISPDSTIRTCSDIVSSVVLAVCCNRDRNIVNHNYLSCTMNAYIHVPTFPRCLSSYKSNSVVTSPT
uniref:Fe2OG dioxygenase domain-containing protein n=1 Tax=Heterorhabditis bacteriophora TaxID=37862 RepID=A0A1I7X724_HETBA